LPQLQVLVPNTPDDKASIVSSQHVIESSDKLVSRSAKACNSSEDLESSRRCELPTNHSQSTLSLSERSSNSGKIKTADEIKINNTKNAYCQLKENQKSESEKEINQPLQILKEQKKDKIQISHSDSNSSNQSKKKRSRSVSQEIDHSQIIKRTKFDEQKVLNESVSSSNSFCTEFKSNHKNKCEKNENKSIDTNRKNNSKLNDGSDRYNDQENKEQITDSIVNSPTSTLRITSDDGVKYEILFKMPYFPGYKAAVPAVTKKQGKLFWRYMSDSIDSSNWKRKSPTIHIRCFCGKGFEGEMKKRSTNKVKKNRKPKPLVWPSQAYNEKVWIDKHLQHANGPINKKVTIDEQRLGCTFRCRFCNEIFPEDGKLRLHKMMCSIDDLTVDFS